MAKNPGQNNNQGEGPPDLDELLSDLKKKIGRIFGKQETDQKTSKPSGGNPTPNSTSDQLPIVPILLIVVLIWVATGFYIVDQGSRGVVLRFGKNTEVTMPGPRWHIPFPIESAEVVNLEQVRTIEVGYRSAGDADARSKEVRESLMLTDDENIIDLQFAVQYNLKSVEDFLFNNRSAESSVEVLLKLLFVKSSVKAKWILHYMKVAKRLLSKPKNLCKKFWIDTIRGLM